MQKHDVIIIGAGASGLMCAIEAGKRGRSVLIIEHSDKPGKKILISGGGRCNFTNLDINSGNYISENPHFCKSALSRFNQHHFISLVESYKIDYYEKKSGQLFCTGKASEILNMLLTECGKYRVEITTNSTITNISKPEKFVLRTTGEIYECESLVIATGGLSIPQMGATPFGYEAARQFGLNVITCRPALTGLLFNKKDLVNFGSLAGVSADVEISCKRIKFSESILFTHKGISGPAVLQISNYWNEGDDIKIDLIPAIDFEDTVSKWQIENPKAELKNLLSRILPKRLAHQLVELFIKNKPVIQYSEKEIKAFGNRLHDFRIIPERKEGYEKAEVTGGGIDTNELSSKTFESNKIKGLYFIGEVVDVTGWLGGYNFQWAWSSGYCAGQYV